MATGSNVNDSFWVSGCGGFTSLKVCKHLKGSPRRFAKAQVHQGDQAKVPSLSLKSFSWGLVLQRATS